MKKLKPTDIFWYNAGEFDEWWKESAKKMEKRIMRKFESKGDMQTSAPQRKGSRKHGRRGPLDMDTGNKF